VHARRAARATRGAGGATVPARRGHFCLLFMVCAWLAARVCRQAPASRAPGTCTRAGSTGKPRAPRARSAWGWTVAWRVRRSVCEGQAGKLWRMGRGSRRDCSQNSLHREGHLKVNQGSSRGQNRGQRCSRRRSPMHLASSWDAVTAFSRTSRAAQCRDFISRPPDGGHATPCP